MTLNEQQKIAKFEEILDSAHEINSCFRVHFGNREIYDIQGFFIGQDNDEDYPHCYTTIARVICVGEKQSQSFNAGAAVMFHLNEVESIEQIILETESTQNST